MSDDKRSDRKVIWLVGGFLGLFLVLALSHRIFVVVPAGHRAVQWNLRGGTVAGEELGEGVHLMWPWNELALYNTRLQSETLEFDAQTLGGLPIKIRVAIRYRPKPGELASLHKEIGRDYLQTYLSPELRALVAGEVAQRDHESLYRERSLLSRALLQSLESGDALTVPMADGRRKALVEVPEIFVNEVVLPPEVETVVTEKFNKQERLEAAEYDLQLADLQNQLLEKEGRGMARFQQQLGPGLKYYLQWKAIEANLKLAESENSKVVVVGDGQQTPVVIDQ